MLVNKPIRTVKHIALTPSLLSGHHMLLYFNKFLVWDYISISYLVSYYEDALFHQLMPITNLFKVAVLFFKGRHRVPIQCENLFHFCPHSLSMRYEALRRSPLLYATPHLVKDVFPTVTRGGIQSPYLRH